MQDLNKDLLEKLKEKGLKDVSLLFDLREKDGSEKILEEVRKILDPFKHNIVVSKTHVKDCYYIHINPNETYV